jgi:cytochrome c oxidase cbb3-type subunit 3
MSDQNKESKNEYANEVRGHSFDGIEEYDNPMPGWWTFTFWITVIWGVAYAVAITFGWVPTYEEDLASGQEEIYDLRRAAEAITPAVVVTDEDLLAASKDPADVAAGKETFAAKCAPCHGAEGQGLIGPNLVDNAWKNGGKPVDIHRIVDEGAPTKGMPAWGPSVGPDGVRQLTAFILSIKGTTPPNPKAAEGEVVK